LPSKVDLSSASLDYQEGIVSMALMRGRVQYLHLMLMRIREVHARPQYCLNTAEEMKILISIGELHGVAKHVLVKLGFVFT
jgi:hypothetical protein